MSSKDVARMLEENGWRQVRQHGSHAVYKKDGMIIPLQCGKKDIPKGTLANIKRSMGVSS